VETISPQSEVSTQWGRRRMIVEFTASYLCNHDVVSSNLDQGDKLVVFWGYPGFRHQWNSPPRYNWNIVESGVKHHQTNKQTTI